MLIVLAPAKLNLTLEVLGRRSDGYHELSTVMQTISLHDTIRLRAWPDLRVTCSDARLSGSENLVWRALADLRRRHGVKDGCWVHIDKRIPVSAGLGGGSSDAASALAGACRFWSVPEDCGGLLCLAEDLGSDVPFFLYGGTCWVHGRGELVTPQPRAPERWYLLANPGTNVSTAEVFATLRESDFSGGLETERLLERMQSGGQGIGPNALQRACFQLCARAKNCFNMVESVAPERTFLSGSGATVAAVFETRQEAETAQSHVAGHVTWTCVTASLEKRAWRNVCARNDIYP